MADTHSKDFKAQPPAKPGTSTPPGEGKGGAAEPPKPAAPEAPPANDVSSEPPSDLAEFVYSYLVKQLDMLATDLRMTQEEKDWVSSEMAKV